MNKRGRVWQRYPGVKQIIKISSWLVKYDGNEETGSISSDVTVLLTTSESGLRDSMEWFEDGYHVYRRWKVHWDIGVMIIMIRRYRVKIWEDLIRFNSGYDLEVIHQVVVWVTLLKAARWSTFIIEGFTDGGKRSRPSLVSEMIGKLSQSTINGLCSQYIFGINTAILHYRAIGGTNVTSSVVLSCTSTRVCRSTLRRNQPRWDFHRGDLCIPFRADETDLWVALLRGVSAPHRPIQNRTDGIRIYHPFSTRRPSSEASGRRRPNTGPSSPACRRLSVPTPPSASPLCAYPPSPSPLP